MIIQSAITSAPHILKGAGSIGRLGARAVSHLAKPSDSQAICPGELMRLEQISRDIQKLTGLLKEAALSVDKYNAKGIERTIIKSTGIVKNLHRLTLSTLEDLFVAAEKLMIDRQPSEAIDGFKRVIDFGNQLGTEEHTVNRLVAKAYYLTAVCEIARNGHEDEVVDLLNKSLEYVPELKESVSLLRDIKNSHWALHKALFAAHYAPGQF